MYKIKDKTYAEAGYILNGNHAIGMWLSSDYAPFTEREIDITNIIVDDTIIKFDIFLWKNLGITSYADAKKFIIQKRYSNDDQIAIILNKDNSPEDTLAYNKMQEWREWASTVASKIMEVIEAQKENNENPEEEETNN